MRPPPLDYATPTTPKALPEVRPSTWLTSLAIVGVVGLLRFGPPMTGYGCRYTAQDHAVMDLLNLGAALSRFEQDTGHFPTFDQGLDALVAQPLDIRSWRGPYVKRIIPHDPWGHPYVYDPTIPTAGKTYTLFSAGPDGREGNADDIVCK